MRAHAGVLRLNAAVSFGEKGYPMKVPQDDYTLGHSAEEHDRLRLQGEMLEPATKRLFQAIGMQSGWRCLDIGCGAGSTMKLMGEIVGPSGEVTGLDRDANAGRDAVAWLQGSGSCRYRFIEADIGGADPIGEPLFDLTFARLSLLHIKDPIGALRKMYSWTKPGGYVVAQDYYCRTMNLYPKSDAGSELIRIIIETSERSGQDMEFAFKLPVHFVEAGIGMPDGTDSQIRMTTAEPFISMYKTLCLSLLPRAIELGVTTEARMRDVFQDLERAGAQGRPGSALWPAMMGVWKRKPAR
jgi:ubiquinone/menaquinone biosynthesis C-methylase UbiE